MGVMQFIFDGIREMLRGPRIYWTWLAALSALVVFGAWNYSRQLTEGLVVTGMSDQVSWGFYISNFARICYGKIIFILAEFLPFKKSDSCSAKES